MKYLSAQIKRISRYLPFAVCMSLLLVLIICLFTVRYFKADESSKENQIIVIGMVGDTSSSFLGFGIEFISKVDSSNMMLSLEEMSEYEAERLLRLGKISAYIRIPEGFFDSAIRGEVMQLDFVTSDVSGGITAVFKEEILSAVSNMLVHSQKGIYAMQELALANGIKDNYANNTDELVLRYISLIIKRPSVLFLDVRGVSDGVDLVTYLTCGLVVLCLSLLGIPYCGMFQNDNKPLRRLAASRGVPVVLQSLCEFAVYFAAELVTVFIVSMLVSVFGIAAVGEVLGVFFACIPALMLISALQFFAFSLADNVASGVMIQFFGAIVLSYICGCIYPAAFFPKPLQIVAEMLPMGVARSYVISVFCGRLDLASVMAALAYSSALVFAASGVTRIKTLSDR